MKTAGIRELKQNASAVVADVIAGEIVIITDRGRPVARLVPLATDPIDALVESGRARRARRDIADLDPPTPPGRGERTPSEVLEEMRSDERW
jgi:prevent-host-death family protein